MQGNINESVHAGALLSSTPPLFFGQCRHADTTDVANARQAELSAHLVSPLEAPPIAVPPLGHAMQAVNREVISTHE
eukprot:8735168-Alexandrium_andersonii.AAC.1